MVYVVTPIRKVRSCPNLLTMSSVISPRSLKKEVIVGSAMAFSSVLLMGNHHHMVSFRELEDIVVTGAIDVLSEKNFGAKSLLNRALRLKKNKAFIALLVFPMFVRILTFLFLQILF